MNNFITFILQDWQTNIDTSFKSRFVLLLFRLTQVFRQLPMPLAIFSLFFRVLYQLIAEWILGIELPWDTQVGPNLKLQHGLALVVNHETIIGANCTLRHSTTIGNKKLSDGGISGSPRIGDDVEIGSNVVILGPISIGDRAVIGAGAVVIKDIPTGAVAVGNPARIIHQESTGNIELTSTESLNGESKSIC